MSSAGWRKPIPVMLLVTLAGSLLSTCCATRSCNRSTVLFGDSGAFSYQTGRNLTAQCSWTVVSPDLWKVSLRFDFMSTIESQQFLSVYECLDAECSIRTRVLAWRLSGELADSSTTSSQHPVFSANGVTSSNGILQVVLSTSEILTENSPGSIGQMHGFSAQWFTPPARFSIATLSHVGPSDACGSSDPAFALRFKLDSPSALRGSEQAAVLVRGIRTTQNDEHLPILTASADAYDPCTATGGYRAARSSKCFRVLEKLQKRTWQEAGMRCQAWGGHLASMDGAEESDTVFKLLRDSGFSSGAWVGLRADEASGEFQWSDGSTSAFRNWFDEPRLSDYIVRYYESGGCGAMSWAPFADPRLTGAPCSRMFPYVCSKHMAVIHRNDSIFCDGASGDVGTWEGESAADLRLALCPGAVLYPDITYHAFISLPAGTALAASGGIEVAAGAPGREIAAAPVHDILEVSPCADCGSGVSRWPEFRCSYCSAPGTQQHSLAMCADCPTGSVADVPSGAQRACVCKDGYYAVGGHCQVCPAGSYCPHGTRERCPGNTSSVPGSARRRDCTCGPGFALSFSAHSWAPTNGLGSPWSADDALGWCVPCPENYYCFNGGTATPCARPKTAPAGSADPAQCQYCRRLSVMEEGTGRLSDGSLSTRPHPRGKACAWVIRPPGAKRVQLTIDEWRPAAGHSAMRVEVGECHDPGCLDLRPLATLADQSTSTPQAVESSTGVMHVVVYPAEMNASLFRSGVEPAQTAGLPSMRGTFVASWNADPRWATKAIWQSNAAASCAQPSALLEINTLRVLLNFRNIDALASNSVITISGLSGAHVTGHEVPVEAGEADSACERGGGGRVPGSDKCFTVHTDAMEWRDAEAACAAAGKRLACIETESEKSLVGNLVAASGKTKAWVGFSYDSGAGRWVWSGGCGSRYQTGPSDRATNRAECQLLSANTRSGQSWEPTLEFGWLRVYCVGMHPHVCSESLPPTKRSQTKFCAGPTEGAGEWAGDGALRLSLCPGHTLLPATDYLIDFVVTNPVAGQASPPIRIAVSGAIELPPTKLDVPPTDIALNGIAGAALPLTILAGGQPDSSCALNLMPHVGEQDYELNDTQVPVLDDEPEHKVNSTQTNASQEELPAPAQPPTVFPVHTLPADEDNTTVHTIMANTSLAGQPTENGDAGKRSRSAQALLTGSGLLLGALVLVALVWWVRVAKNSTRYGDLDEAEDAKT